MTQEDPTTRDMPANAQKFIQGIAGVGVPLGGAMGTMMTASAPNYPSMKLDHVAGNTKPTPAVAAEKRADAAPAKAPATAKHTTGTRVGTAAPKMGMNGPSPFSGGTG